MRIVFLNITTDVLRKDACLHPRHKLPPADLGCTISLARLAGHAVTFIDTWVEPLSMAELLERISAHAPEVLVIRPGLQTDDIVAELARRLRATVQDTVTIVAMGGYATACPASFINAASLIDLLVNGEPEMTMQEILARRSRGQGLTGIAGTSYYADGRLVHENDRPLISDLDSLPVPAHDLFSGRGYTFLYPVQQKERISFASVMTSRGCPSQCAHCSPVVRVSSGKQYRVRSVENVLGELRVLAAQGVNTVYFCDDNFAADRRRVLSLCAALRHSGLDLRWAAQARIDNLAPELLSAMRAAGCGCINVGIESLNPDVMANFNKKFSRDQIATVARQARDAGINLNADFIIGSPGETEQDLHEILDFSVSMDFSLVTLLGFVSYPGSALYEQLGATCDLRRNTIYSYETDSSAHEAVERMRREFYRRYYCRPRYIMHYLRHCFSLRNWPVQRALFSGALRYLLS